MNRETKSLILTRKDCFLNHFTSNKGNKATKTQAATEEKKPKKKTEFKEIEDDD